MASEIAWAPVIAWAALIFAFSAQPNLRFVPDEGLDFVVRKLGHMGVFGILALLAWRALAVTIAWRRPWVLALVLTLLYAISDEVHQGGVAGRHESAVDVGIDVTGALIAVAVVGLVLALLDARLVARAPTHRVSEIGTSAGANPAVTPPDRPVAGR